MTWRLEKGADGRSVKSRLLAYRESERDIAAQSEEYERIRTRLEGLGGQVISDMPKSPNTIADRMSDLISQKIEIEESLNVDVAEHRSERMLIRKTLKKLRSADERAVIRFRYLLGLCWYDVAYAMFGDRGDYLEKEASYLRRAQRIHVQALNHLAEYLK